MLRPGIGLLRVGSIKEAGEVEIAEIAMRIGAAPSQYPQVDATIDRAVMPRHWQRQVGPITGPAPKPHPAEIDVLSHVASPRGVEVSEDATHGFGFRTIDPITIMRFLMRLEPRPRLGLSEHQMLDAVRVSYGLPHQRQMRFMAHLFCQSMTRRT